MSFVRFCLVGVINTFVGFSIILALMHLAQVDYRAANAVGYAIGFTISYTLNKSWTFSHRGAVLTSVLKWMLVVAAAYALNLAVVTISHEFFGLNVDIAQGLGIPTYTMFSFLGGRFFAFAPARKPASA